MKFKKISILAIVPFIVGCGESGGDEPVKVTTYEADGTLVSVDTYVYDENGKVTEFLSETKYDGKTTNTKCVLSYSNGVLDNEVISTFDATANNWRVSGKISYEYENGDPIKETYCLFKDGAYVNASLDKFTYNTDHKMSTSESYFYNDEINDFEKYMSVTFEYNSNKQLYKEYSYMDLEIDEGLELVQYKVYSYNDDGKVARVDEYYYDDSLVGYTSYSYSKKEETESYFQIQDDNTTLEKIKNVRALDGKGRVVRDDYYNLDDEGKTLVLDSYTVYEY